MGRKSRAERKQAHARKATLDVRAAYVEKTGLQERKPELLEGDRVPTRYVLRPTKTGDKR